MKQATSEKRAVVQIQKEKEEEDVAEPYQESRFRKREAEAAAITITIKKGSHAGITCRRSSLIVSTAFTFTAARDAKLIATATAIVKKEATNCNCKVGSDSVQKKTMSCRKMLLGSNTEISALLMHPLERAKMMRQVLK